MQTRAGMNTYTKHEVHGLQILGAGLGLELGVASAHIEEDWVLHEGEVEVSSLAARTAYETVLEATEDERALTAVDVVHREGRCGADDADTATGTALEVTPR